jgi:two-component system, LytTR family, sensor kinase
MNPDKPSEAALLRADRIRARVHEIGEFYRRLMAFCIAMPIMLAVNFFVVPHSGYWSLIVLGIWGLLLVLRALRLFMRNTWFSEDWEERKVREQLAQRERQP